MTASDQRTADVVGAAATGGDVAVVAEGPVLLTVGADGVGVVTLNRPERRNAWNPELERHYFEVLERVDRDPRVRVVVVTGAGRTFCPGVDSERLDGIADAGLDLSGRRSPVLAWSLRKPMIAAVNGACAGMGLVQALLCDVRFAARGARFTTAFARRGLAGEFGVTWLLPRLIGAERAADLLLSGRVFDADEASALGLVSRVVEPGELVAAARAYAADIAANCSPASLALLRHQLHADQQSDLETALRRSYRAMAVAVKGADFREGLDSFLEKRKPAFPPLADDLDPVAVTGAGLPETAVVPQEALES
ncbi:enoyl-CoA hydratase/isomerase family protein [Frankia sp. CNm7]|uniref:Enoyl-CoA hydratase/isomerase family protein n=1 Tax=Frankia nepalensis TaxID=1836974 RepID=A0A937URF1_9ACTN|nr:enoyl-CoA hydratase/isomerase family protein [Frankia nepalensis]MBL7512963.1 enoyl-CoA hydratase/isomerase family protein [Frankia nepalensis]MBL7519470.1 enoyl-CoA hydratase/isomerase family protein [Frankia nepalensis]MBL7631292.1 enoyl-CoA hydratase/isomerase family protein [Frankia nepalensis]